MAENIKTITWYRTPIPRDILKTLTARSNIRGFLQSAGILLLYIGTLSTAVFFFLNKAWILMITACYVHSMFHGFIGMEASVHELSHGTPFKTKALNEFFYTLFCFLSWNNPVHFRTSHTLHHKYTVHRGLDKEVLLEPVPFTLTDWISWFTFDWKKFRKIMIPNLAHFFGRADADYFSWDPLFPPGDIRRKQMCSRARLMFAGHIILFFLFLWSGLWVLIYLVTFGYFFATFLSKWCTIQQHSGLCPDIPDWRVTCHTVKFHPLMRFLYWHMNYHREHHMYAAVPFFNLGKLHELIAYDCPVPVNGYCAGVKRIIELKKMQRKDPAFCFIPDFPPESSPPQLAEPLVPE